MKTTKLYTMQYYFISGFILLGLVIGICTLHIYRGMVRRKELVESKEIDELFDTIEPFDFRYFVEPPTDAFDETELQGHKN